MKSKKPAADRPFPWTCSTCGKAAVYEDIFPYTTTGHHDNLQFELEIDSFKAPKCRECGAVVFGRTANAQISDAIRSHLKLLSPEEIRTSIATLGISQREVASGLHVAPETLSRWISGAIIQSRNNDHRLRDYFGSTLHICTPVEDITRIECDNVSEADFQVMWIARIHETQVAQELVAASKTAWGIDLCAEVA